MYIWVLTKFVVYLFSLLGLFKIKFEYFMLSILIILYKGTVLLRCYNFVNLILL